MFHVRFTPHDISGYTFDFLDSLAHRYIVGYEDKDKYGRPAMPHYHVLVDTTYGDKSLRDAFKAACKIPPAGRGKNNMFYAVFPNWQDPGYMCKWNDVRLTKGFSEKEIMDYVISGKQKYLKKVEEIPDGPVSSTGNSRQAKVRVPFQQAVIAQAAADWFNYKRTVEVPDKNMIVDFVLKAMRENGRGINRYMVKEICWAILYDDIDFQEKILKKIKSEVWL